MKRFAVLALFASLFAVSCSSGHSVACGALGTPTPVVYQLMRGGSAPSFSGSHSSSGSSSSGRSSSGVPSYSGSHSSSGSSSSGGRSSTGVPSYSGSKSSGGGVPSFSGSRSTPNYSSPSYHYSGPTSIGHSYSTAGHLYVFHPASFYQPYRSYSPCDPRNNDPFDPYNVNNVYSPYYHVHMTYTG